MIAIDAFLIRLVLSIGCDHDNMNTKVKKTEKYLRPVGSFDRIVRMQTNDRARESYDRPRWKLQWHGGGVRCHGRHTASAEARGKAGSPRGGLAVPKVRGGQAVLGVGIEIWGRAPNSEADHVLVT